MDLPAGFTTLRAEGPATSKTDQPLADRLFAAAFGLLRRRWLAPVRRPGKQCG